jgi:hypothetical protein
MTLEDLRKPRLFGFVVFDWVLTIIATLVLSRLFGQGFVSMLVIVLLLSIILHVMFNVPTLTNYYLGLSERPNKL